MDALAIDPAMRATFTVVHASDPGRLDGTTRVIERTAEPSRFYNYQLRDRALWPMRFKSPIFSMASRNAGSILATYVGNRFATDISIDGEDGDLFCFTAPLHGKITLVDNGDSTTATDSCGLAFRPGPGARLQISDHNARTNVFLKVSEVEDTLERTLDEHLRRPLKFRPSLDWSRGLAASLKFQLDFVMREFQRSDGVASNPVALASMTDLVISLALRGAPHNYSDLLDNSSAGVVPAYIRRAEEFMRANCAEPIRMAHVAAAAGCSVGTLGVVFQRFRGKTPLGALHAIRLEQARCELIRGGTGATIATVAQRHGFTNSARFTIAFRQRFGETPSEAARRASRS
jgi:AraC-like DNA-binding protein